MHCASLCPVSPLCPDTQRKKCPCSRMSCQCFFLSQWNVMLILYAAWCSAEGGPVGMCTCGYQSHTCAEAAQIWMKCGSDTEPKTAWTAVPHLPTWRCLSRTDDSFRDTGWAGYWEGSKLSPFKNVGSVYSCVVSIIMQKLRVWNQIRSIPTAGGWK